MLSCRWHGCTQLADYMTMILEEAPAALAGAGYTTSKQSGEAPAALAGAGYTTSKQSGEAPAALAGAGYTTSKQSGEAPAARAGAGTTRGMASRDDTLTDQVLATRLMQVLVMVPGHQPVPFDVCSPCSTSRPPGCRN